MRMTQAHCVNGNGTNLWPTLKGQLKAVVGLTNFKYSFTKK